MDISAQIKKLAESRQGLEDQVKSLKGEIRDINVKIRKLETIARHAEDVLWTDPTKPDTPVVSDFPIGGKFGNVQCESGPIEIISGSRLNVPRETTSNGSGE